MHHLVERGRDEPAQPDQIGLLIADIDNGSVAKRAGLQMGDVLVAAGDKPFRRPTDLMAALRSASKSQPIRLSLIRAGRQLALEVVVRS